MDAKFELTEEVADMLERMAVSYNADAKAQGKSNMGGAFLNGYQTAVSNMLESIKANPNLIFHLPQMLEGFMEAFDELCRRGGIKPSIIVMP